MLAAGVFVYKREEKKEETIKNFSCDPISRRLKLHEWFIIYPYSEIKNEKKKLPGYGDHEVWVMKKKLADDLQKATENYWKKHWKRTELKYIEFVGGWTGQHDISELMKKKELWIVIKRNHHLTQYSKIFANDNKKETYFLNKSQEDCVLFEKKTEMIVFLKKEDSFFR